MMTECEQIESMINAIVKEIKISDKDGFEDCQEVIEEAAKKDSPEIVEDFVTEVKKLSLGKKKRKADRKKEEKVKKEEEVKEEEEEEDQLVMEKKRKITPPKEPCAFTSSTVTEAKEKFQVFLAGLLMKEQNGEEKWNEIMKNTSSPLVQKLSRAKDASDSMKKKIAFCIAKQHQANKESISDKERKLNQELITALQNTAGATGIKVTPLQTPQNCSISGDYLTKTNAFNLHIKRRDGPDYVITTSKKLRAFFENWVLLCSVDEELISTCNILNKQGLEVSKFVKVEEFLNQLFEKYKRPFVNLYNELQEEQQKKLVKKFGAVWFKS